MPNAKGTKVYSEKPGSSLKRDEPVSSASFLSLQAPKYPKELSLNSHFEWRNVPGQMCSEKYQDRESFPLPAPMLLFCGDIGPST